MVLNEDIVMVMETDTMTRGRYEHLAVCAECRALAKIGAQVRLGLPDA